MISPLKNNHDNMKHLLLFLVIVSMTACSNLKNLNGFAGYHGKPKYVETATFELKENSDIDSVRQTAYKSVYHFDKEGRIINNSTFKPDGSLNSCGWEYDYAKNGSINQKILYNPDSTINNKVNYYYNKNGVLDSIESKYGVKKHYFYDENGNLIHLTGTKKGEFFENSRFKYDSNNRRIELIVLNENNDVTKIIRSEYDSMGNKTKSSWYNANDQLYVFYKSEYDSYGNKISNRKYSVKKNDTVLISAEKTKYRLDNYNNVIQSITENDNYNSTWITENRFVYWD